MADSNLTTPKNPPKPTQAVTVPAPKFCKGKPRLMREGFKPAESQQSRPETDMLVPKKPIPRIGKYGYRMEALPFIFGRFAHPEQYLLERFVETADVLEVGDSLWFLVPADERYVEELSAYRTDVEDCEDGGDAEPEVGGGSHDDRELEHDAEGSNQQLPNPR